MSPEQIQEALFVLMNAAGVMFPVSAPFITLAETIIASLRKVGVETPPHQIERLTAMSAGIAAAQSSAVTRVLNRLRGKPNV
jgi:hypothetical protein